ncbi:MAG: glycosyltransferase [Clostridia bacterium]|nr:glycosyltransferase [Clostridia bacterium]
MIIGELTETFPPMMDGVGRVCWAYCREMEKKGHRAYYIAPDDPDHSRFPDLRTLTYKGIQIPGQNYRIGVPDWSPEFRREIRGISFDALHIHSPFLSARVALEIRKENPKIPLVATFHSKYYDDALKITHSKTISGGIVNLVLGVYNQCDEVWTLNGETADVLRAYGYRGDIEIFPNGTDIYDFDPSLGEKARVELGIPSQRKVLLFVGQISRKKNIHSVLQAAALLKKQGQDFILLLAGVGPDMGNLRRLAEQLEITDCTRFLGFIRDGETLRRLYTLADLFLFPSLYDNAPMVVREAAVNGTASVLVRGSCSAEGVEDGVNGFLCDNSPEDIAKTVLRGLGRAEEAGAAARRTIPLPWDQIVDRVLARYAELIEKRKNK